MTHTVHPYAHRLGIIRDWKSRWFADRGQYQEYLKADILLREFLVKRLRGTTLDIGCGIGDMLAFHPNTVGADINIRTVDFCKANGLDAHHMQPDVLPFDNSLFDSVLLDNVLEHIAAPMPLLDEVRRVVKPGGRLLIGVPGKLGWRSDADHKIFYDEGALINCVEPHGFLHNETFHSPLWKSEWFSEKVRQYCIYSVFSRVS